MENFSTLFKIIFFIVATKQLNIYYNLFISCLIAGKEGKTALMYASEKGFLKVVRALIERGADVNATDKLLGDTVLIYAINSRSVKKEVVVELIKHGADTRAVNKLGVTVWMHALSGGDLRTVESLLLRSKEIDLNDKSLYGKTALLSALEREHIKLAMELILRGADVNVADVKGKTALMYASEKGFLKVVRALIERGANVNAVDSFGETALLYAKEYPAVVRELIKHGARDDRFVE